ncbi:hypothetical protein Pint_01207 [Pistacia integerrima]|uniref:Uncharacterized protein n=1 Tax=Pistacia integerrima TaxID=434235 RepID=A0ACC0ZQ94_9ROSI|nr:hypothetical protein Pint_01207 [Pistacia integerrima]
MGNPQTHHFDAQNIGNESKAEYKSQYPDNTNISDSGITSHSSGSEVKANSKGENKGLKKHRYAFQTRSQIDILDDGYRWRKYGQKTVKSGKFPSCKREKTRLHLLINLAERKESSATAPS